MLMRLFGLWVRLWIWIHGGRRSVIRAGEYDLVLYDIGPREGEPWLLLHGLGATALSWTPLMKALSGRHRLLIPELSNFGGTLGPHPAITVAESSGVIASLLQQILPDRPATIAGMSLGGWMAVRFAIAQPQRVERLLLIDTAGWRDQDWAHVEDLVRLRNLADVDRLYKALFVNTPWLLRHSRRTFLKAYTAPAVTSILENTSEELVFDASDLEKMTVATGVIWAAHDGLFPPAVGERVAAALQNSRLIIVPNCGHGLHWERPRAFVNAVTEWRSELGESPA